MRVSAVAKAETRERIIEVATKMFSTEGWDNTTTRAIASAAGIATGTLFNYYESKEAIVAALMSTALDEAQEEVRKRRGHTDSVEEELFSLIWTELRSLRRFRTFLPAAAETIFSPMRRSLEGSPGESLRANHLEAVEGILSFHETPAPSPLTMQLYWTLYLGVFAYWATDESPKQEDTLALLDQSLKLFITALTKKQELEKTHERKLKGSPRRSTARHRRTDKRGS